LFSRSALEDAANEPDDGSGSSFILSRSEWRHSTAVLHPFSLSSRHRYR
jgi:hypothetical protein